MWASRPYVHSGQRIYLSASSLVCRVWGDSVSSFLYHHRSPLPKKLPPTTQRRWFTPEALLQD